MEKKNAIVLGGTLPHIELIRELKNRGYYIILLDIADNPLAIDIADEHVKISTLDKKEVLAFAKTRQISLIITTCSDQAIVTACYVAQDLGLPKPFDYEISCEVSSKNVMKKKMVENGIPTSKYHFVNNHEDIKKIDLKYPLVVKPYDTYGSRGVNISNNDLELEKNLSLAIDISRGKAAIIEEFNPGIEVQADFFVQDGQANLLMTRQKHRIRVDGKLMMQTYRTTIPAEINRKATEKLVCIANRISHVFKLTNTSLFIQANINSDEVKVIEFSPRVGGGLSFRLIKRVTGFDIISATIDSFTGLKTRIVFDKPSGFLSTHLLYTYPCEFGQIVGLQELKQRNVIEEYFIYKKEKSIIDSSLSSNNRVGAFFLGACTKEELLKKNQIAIDSVNVYDITGKPVLRREIYNPILE